jgi:hypothetical protein
MKRHVLFTPLLVLLTLNASAFDTGTLSRDRAAIMAMAGEYHVDFDFRETVALRPGYQLTEPYHAEATEYVEVIEDRGDFISLQHILVMQDDAGVSQVVKHWRQDWQYQPAELLSFNGERRWVQLPVDTDAAHGAWSQTVWQVDDSPRYSGVGRWQHDGSFSAWTSNRSWRPLPRREYTKRDDYDVMVATNRQVITPDGWVHEQDNSKLDLDNPGAPYIAHEIGVNKYTRIDGHDFSAGHAYWRQTAALWQSVRDYWDVLLAERDSVQLAAEVDGEKLYEALFSLADRLTTAEPEPLEEVLAEVRPLLDRFVLGRSLDTTQASSLALREQAY